ncbi:MAG: hypothetical protein IH947_14545 [Bacteroidetes bacterium]|nr:hypothetical protein [Bacteroidota bacterium]
MDSLLKMRNLFCLVLSTSLIIACGPQTKEQASEDAVEETASAPQNVTYLAINHDIEDWETWKAAFDAHEPNRMENDMEVSALFRSVENENNVWVVLRTKDHESAAAFASSEDLKTVMKENGVLGEPEFVYLDNKWFAEGEVEFPSHVAIIHEVADYDSWKNEFDKGKPVRTENGFELRGISVTNDNPNKVWCLFACEDITMAKEYCGSDEFKQSLEKAGVTEEPRILYLASAN